MAYDPRQMMQRGGLTPPAPAFEPYAPQNQWWTQPQQPQGVQFAPAPAPQQPKQWYEGLQTPKDPYGKGTTDKTAAGKQPQSLLDMLMTYGQKPSGGAGATTMSPQGSSLGPIPGMGLMNSPWFLT
jgi:hypothetical protein